MNIQAFRAPAVQAYQATSSVKRSAMPGTATAAAKPMAASSPSVTPGLQQDEQQMIARYFPGSSEMTMRLYGPGRGTQTVHPGALGRHLDLQG